MISIHNQKGVSLIITFFIMLIAIAIVLSISTLLYSQIRVIRNIGDSVVAFFAADSGVEKILFYDRQVVPNDAKRGFCSIFDLTNNDNPCITDPNPSDVNSDHSIYCNAFPGGPNPPALVVLDPVTHENGCDPDVCDSCKVEFQTTISDNKKYTVSATISPSADGESSNFSIDSIGSFESVDRAVNLIVTKSLPQQVITIVYAYATPRSVQNGTAIEIEVRAQSDNGISQVFADIKNSDATDGTNIVDTVELSCTPSDIKDRICTGSHVLSAGAYYVDVDVTDMKDIKLTQENIPPYIP